MALFLIHSKVLHIDCPLILDSDKTCDLRLPWSSFEDLRLKGGFLQGLFTPGCLTSLDIALWHLKLGVGSYKAQCLDWNSCSLCLVETSKASPSFRSHFFWMWTLLGRSRLWGQANCFEFLSFSRFCFTQFSSCWYFDVFITMFSNAVSSLVCLTFLVYVYMGGFGCGLKQSCLSEWNSLSPFIFYLNFGNTVSHLTGTLLGV